MKKKIIIPTTILIIIGLIMILSSTYTVSEYKFNNPYKYFFHQSIFALIGYFIMYFIGRIDYLNLKKNSTLLFLISTFLLIIVLIPGIGSVRNGSRSWFSIGPFGIQPSEITKIVLIIFTSKYLSKYSNKMKDIKKNTLPLLIVILSSFLLILLEPDFGSGMIIVLSIIILIFTSEINLSFFVKCGFLGIIGIILLILIAPYRMKRILSFLNPWSDPLGSGFQIIMSMYAVGPNGLFGSGLGNSIQKRFYLPEPGTDFIFSIIAEELGFIGVVIVLFLYLYLFIQIIKISLNTKNEFAKYLSFGIGIEIIFQTLLNLMVVVGLIPVTGVTLPFISYGGSSLLTNMLMIGIILSIENKNNT